MNNIILMQILSKRLYLDLTHKTFSPVFCKHEAQNRNFIVTLINTTEP